jgi:hypothetical protein
MVNRGGRVSNLGVFAYCAAVGFAAAATMATFYQLVTSQRPELFAVRSNVAGLIFAVVLSMFCGPFIVVRRVFEGLKSRELKVLPALIGTAIAGMWSVCAGIFYVSLLIAA